MGDKCGREVGDKCKIMRPKTFRVGDSCGRQIGGKCKNMRQSGTSVGDKRDTSVKSCGPEHGTKRGIQVGDTCKITRPRAPRVGDKWETNVKACTQSAQNEKKTMRETSVETNGGQVQNHGETSGRQV